MKAINDPKETTTGGEDQPNQDTAAADTPEETVEEGAGALVD